MEESIIEEQIFEFWNWFSINEKRFWEQSDKNAHEFLNEIQQKLDFASDSEEYEIALESSQLKGLKKRLEISADGVIELFDVVIKIVERAPKLNYWEIVAFRQPIPTPFCLRFNDLEFDTSKMYYLAYNDDSDELNLVVFGDNFKKYDENKLFLYGLTTIDNLIGEYNCVTKIKGYDFLDVEEIGDNNVYPLEQLPEFLEEYYNNN